MMGPYNIEGETTEIWLLRSILELRGRILMATTSEQRESLRGTAYALRAELLKLVEAIPIPDETDVARTRGEFAAMGPMMIRSGGSS